MRQIQIRKPAKRVGLHQLCAPVLDLRQRLPAPQRGALATLSGLSAEPAPDRFVVGLAILGLLSEIFEERPLVCMVDDAQWLDDASALALAFVARRPLSLLALARGWAPAELAGGFALPDVMPLVNRIEQSSMRRLESLPAPTRRLLLIAAAEPQPTPGRGRYGSMCVPSRALRVA
jgi:hypothetical protein